MKSKLKKEQLENLRAEFLVRLCRMAYRKWQKGMSVHAFYHEYIKAIPQKTLRKNNIKSLPLKSWERIFLTWRRNRSAKALKRNYAGVKLRKFSSDTIRLILQKAIQDQVTLSQITRYFKRLNQEMYPSYPTILFRVSKIFMRHYRRWLMTEAKAKAFRKEADLRKQNLHRMIQEVA